MNTFKISCFILYLCFLQPLCAGELEYKKLYPLLEKFATIEEKGEIEYARVYIKCPSEKIPQLWVKLNNGEDEAKVDLSLLSSDVLENVDLLDLKYKQQGYTHRILVPLDFNLYKNFTLQHPFDNGVLDLSFNKNVKVVKKEDFKLRESLLGTWSKNVTRDGTTYLGEVTYFVNGKVEAKVWKKAAANTFISKSSGKWKIEKGLIRSSFLKGDKSEPSMYEEEIIHIDNKVLILREDNKLTHYKKLKYKAKNPTTTP